MLWLRETLQRPIGGGECCVSERATGRGGVSNSDDLLPPSGTTLRQAFEQLITAFHDHRVRYAIIGGIAIIQHTRVRATDDIDALVVISQLEMPGFFEHLSSRGFTVDVVRSIRELRDEGITSLRFGDVVVDLMRPVIPAYVRVLERAVEIKVFDRFVRISSAEGLVLMKVIAMRPQDEVDIRDLLTAYADSLDLDFVRNELDAITEPDDPRRVKFEAWVANLHGPTGD